MTASPKPVSDQDGFFWKTKTLEEMSNAEWESLCDGCARCCLEKLEDEDTSKIYFTHVSCKLLDAGLCTCKDYPNRSDKVPDCVRLTPQNVRTLNWLPPSCGYRLVAEGRDLYWWHPLVSGDPNTVHEAGVSVRGRVQGTETVGDGEQMITALVPTSEVLRYAIDLRSLTGGRGRFKVQHDHYDTMPSHLVDKVVKAREEESAK